MPGRQVEILYIFGVCTLHGYALCLPLALELSCSIVVVYVLSSGVSVCSQLPE